MVCFPRKGEELRLLPPDRGVGPLHGGGGSVHETGVGIPVLPYLITLPMHEIIQVLIVCGIDHIQYLCGVIQGFRLQGDELVHQDSRLVGPLVLEAQQSGSPL